MSNSEKLLWTAITESFCKLSALIPTEKWLDALNPDHISRLVIKKEKTKDDTFIAKKEVHIATGDSLGATDQRVSNAQLAFVRQAITTLKASLPAKIRDHSREAVADTLLGRPEKDSSDTGN